MPSVAYWIAREAAPVMRAPRLSHDALERVVERRLRSVVAAAVHAPFQRRALERAGVAWRHVGDSPGAVPLRTLLTRLEPVHKASLRDAGLEALCGGRLQPTWRSSRSSGSTGEPFIMYFDPRAWAVQKYLVKLRARRRCGLRVVDRVAVLDAIPAHGRARALLERVGRVGVISVLQPLGQVVAALRACRPDVIYGLPSVLEEIAMALAATPLRTAPRMIFTGGELLAPAVRARIAAAFDACVHDVYGTSETKEVAWECATGAMHVNADVLLAEVLDARGEPAAAGDVGELVVTSLVNTAMPLLRYRTGDLASLLGGACACGATFPRLGIVTGREVETVMLRTGRRVSPYELTCAMETVGGVRRYQLRQTAEHAFVVSVVPDRAADVDAIRRRAIAALERVLGDVRVETQFVDTLTRGPRGKERVVEALAP